MTDTSRKTLLRTELLILLAFFIFAAVTCTYMFMKAYDEAKDAEALGKAVVKTTSIAETLKAKKGDLAKTGALLGEKSSYETGDDSLTLYLGSSMEPVSRSAAAYTAVVTKEKKGLLDEFVITVRESEESTVVYELDLKAVTGGGK